MATTTISGSGTRNDKGTIFGAGNIGGERFASLTQVNSTKNVNPFSPVYASWRNGVESVLKGSGVSITGITQSSSTGFVNIEKSSHGFSVGDLIVVYGADVAGYNRTHRVTVVTNANNFRTDVLYSADTTTHGSYKPFSGVFNKVVAGTYTGRIIGNTVAGNASSILRIPANYVDMQPIATARGNYRYNITGWNYITGAATKGANAGDAVTYVTPADAGTVSAEPYPTRAVPGELVYFNGHKDGAVQADYKEKTQ